MAKFGMRLLAWWLKHEPLWLMLLAWLAFAAIPVRLGYVGLSYDALNHHIYLGWLAEQSRFAQDVWAAGSQSYQVPYAYWPVYRMAMAGFSGVQAGVALAAISALSVPAVWMMARQLISGHGLYEAVMRGLAVMLAYGSIVVLSLFGSTQNDVLAAIPLVWAFALAMESAQAHGPKATRLPRAGGTVVAGLLAGVSVTLKLSNGPLALLLLLVWALHGPSLRQRLESMAWGGCATVAGWLLSFAPWGWGVWRAFGNPIYPLYDSWFEPLRTWAGWLP